MVKLGLSVLVAGTVVFATVFCLFGQIPSNPFPFSLNPGAAVALRTDGTTGPLSVGFAKILTNAGATLPGGFGIFELRSNTTVVSEATVPASATVLNTAFFVEIAGDVTTGVAIANPNTQPATISFDYQDPAIRFRGGGINAGIVTIPGNTQISGFINEAPFNSPAPYFGMMRLTSTIPIGVTALRGLRNERNEFLMTTIIEPDTTRQRGSNVTAPQAVVGYIPLLVDGGGWSTEFVLRNPDFDDAAAGTLDFFDTNGNPLPVMIDGQSTLNRRFNMQRGEFERFKSDGVGSNTRVGAIRVTSDAHSFSPDFFTIYTFRRAGVTVSMASAPMVQPAQMFRLYVEAAVDAAGLIETGVVVHNTSANAATVSFELTDLNGTSVGQPVVVNIPRLGQISKFLREIPGFGSVSLPFRGVLRVSTNNADGISVLGIRGHYNQRGDFLITTVLPFDETQSTQPPAQLAFPHVADGGGYSTDFVLFNSGTSTSSGTVSGFLRNGVPLNINRAP
jgi:hypothetical protein